MSSHVVNPTIGVDVSVLIFQIQSLLVSVPADKSIVQQLQLIQGGLQIIVISLYTWLFRYINLTNLSDMRYYEWGITTTTVLLTTMAYMKYSERVEKGQSTTCSVFGLMNEYRSALITIGISNFMMLSIGYLVAHNIIPRTQGAIMLFAFFGVTFYTMYQFAKQSREGKNLFKIMLILWSAYGFVFLFPELADQPGFTLLDLVAKNFMNVYLGIKLNRLHM